APPGRQRVPGGGHCGPWRLAKDDRRVGSWPAAAARQGCARVRPVAPVAPKESRVRPWRRGRIDPPWPAPDVVRPARKHRALSLRRLVIKARSRPAWFAGWAAAGILALAAATAYGVALWKAPHWMHATTAQARYNARVLVISVGGAGTSAGPVRPG